MLESNITHGPGWGKPLASISWGANCALSPPEFWKRARESERSEDDGSRGCAPQPDGFGFFAPSEASYSTGCAAEWPHRLLFCKHVYVISFTSWLPPLTRLVTCQGQLPAFIDVLGKKLDAADEMLVYNSATRKIKIAINKMIWPLEEKLAQIATTRSEGLPNCTLSAPSICM